jgi:LmbE family N-acetylglucosaminyl deacetylase
LDAVFPYARDHLAYPDLLEEGLDPHVVKEVWCWAAEDPNYWSDITATFETKMAALRLHESQVSQFPSPEWDELMRRRYEKAAEGESCELAETFHRVQISW